ncbi:MAG: hypothetical protein JXN63_03485 [Candidatus Delongbacteria bacterium]|nr:hypothetical protein [Candidatus Delongbacteria bacterium]
MKFKLYFLVTVFFLSCTIDRTLSKYQSGEEFNSLAKKKDAKVKLISGKELPVKNISYDGEIFSFDRDETQPGTLPVDSVQSIEIYKTKRFITALKYAGTGLVISYLSGIAAMTIASSDEKIWAERVIGIGFLCTTGMTVRGAVKGVEAHYEIVNWKKE